MATKNFKQPNAVYKGEFPLEVQEKPPVLAMRRGGVYEYSAHVRIILAFSVLVNRLKDSGVLLTHCWSPESFYLWQKR